MRAIANPYVLYIGMRSVNAFAFALVLTYELAYHTVIIGLTPFQLVLVGVVLESMTLIFEIPTGIFADLVSRRLSVILGIMLTGAGFMLEILIPSFATVILAQVLWGIGFTFYSGAEAAWIVDEVGLERAHAAFLRATQLSQVLTIAGTLCGALLAAISISVPVIVGASLLLALGVSLWFTMSETGFEPAARSAQHRHWAQLLQPVRDSARLVRIHPLLWMILLLGAPLACMLAALIVSTRRTCSLR
ncbi:MAG: hypothetical protein MI924_34445 [Chloroflexales bacterium]|nr:hypothetical protein [Chloroflexales bacterium]